MKTSEKINILVWGVLMNTRYLSEYKNEIRVGILQEAFINKKKHKKKYFNKYRVPILSLPALRFSNRQHIIHCTDILVEIIYFLK
jgi:hypothetical protein